MQLSEVLGAADSIGGAPSNHTAYTVESQLGSHTDGTMPTIDTKQFRKLCRQAVRNAGEISAVQRDAILQGLRLRRRYPGEYVAYIDRYPARDKVRRLARELIAHDSDLLAVNDCLSQFARKKRLKVMVQYLDPLLGDFRVLHDYPFR